MTNFEKYKQNMTVEELGDMVSSMGDNGVECACFCPCYEFCKATSKTGNPTDVWDIYPSAPNESECTGAVREWAKQEAEEETKYIVRCELDVGVCMFSSFWNGRHFVKGEENAKVFHRRESAEEELNRFGYSPSDYSILTIQTKTTEK